MICTICSAAILEPLIEGGVSVRKIGQKAIKASAFLGFEERSRVQQLSDTANYLAAQLAHTQLKLEEMEKIQK